MTIEQILDKALGAYLGFACGDALGATVEFMKPHQIQKRYGIHQDIIGGGWLALPAGQVTDDTQMALALGQAIIDCQGWRIQTVADYFLSWMESQPPDIGNTTRRGITRYRDTGVLFGLPRLDDAGNGACMRNLPIVLATLNREDDFKQWSLQQSHITHNNPLSDAATITLGRMVKYLILEQNMERCLDEAHSLIQQHKEFAFSPYSGKASAYIADTVQTVFHYFFNHSSFESCLIATVNQGDDADTTGALAGMLAGAKYGLKHIPKRWLEQLDQEVVSQIRQQTLELLKLTGYP